MMKSKFLVLLLCAQAVHAAPGEIALPDAAQIKTQCAATLAKADADIAAYLKRPVRHDASFLQLWNHIMVDVAVLPTGLLAEVSPDAAVRAESEACERKQTEFFSRQFTRPELYARLSKVKSADAIDAVAQRQLADAFIENGVNLRVLPRTRVRQIVRELQIEEQGFQRALRDNRDKLAFSKDELAGVPDSALARATRDDQGRYLFGFDYPEADAIMRNAEREATRRNYRFAFTRRGGEANLARLDRIVALRAELASLMGKADFATLVTARNMAGSPARVNAFLADVAGRVKALEARDLTLLRDEKRRYTNDPAAELKAWDVRFYEDRLLKAQYEVDDAEVRRLFPTEASVAWVLRVAEELYGIRFKANPGLPIWQQDVRAFDVSDGASGAYLGTVYLDLYPREGKYKHAAAFGLRPVSTLAQVTPVSVLVTNFSRDGLNRNELKTLFHEFGHALHGVLSRTRYAFNAGTQVKRDFVEAPSQMFESWVWRPEALALFAQACPDCRPVPMELVARIKAAEQFNKGYFYAGQALLASYDMALYAGRGDKAMPLWQKMEGASALGHVPGTQFPGTFAHVAGGYAAGYYGYLWSEVLARDMFSAFGGNAMNPEVGLRYRKTILERGGEVEPMQLVRDFLGREPGNDAFIRALNGKED